MTRLVVLGDVMVDVVCRLDGPLALGSDAPARIELGYGGSGANVAAWAAVAGTGSGDPPVLAGRIGADDRGRAAEAELRAAGVDTRLAVDPERPTGTCVVLVGPDGERSMVPDPGANDGLEQGDLADELLIHGAHMHLTGYSLVRDGSRPAARAAIARALQRGMSVSVDPSSAALLSPRFLDEVAGVGVLMPNLEEAVVLSGEAEAGSAALTLARSVPEVVVTMGGDGALWTDGTGISRVEADASGTALDTTGAGDAFAAGFLVARLSGAGPEAALRAGCRLAAVAVRTPGARPSA